MDNGSGLENFRPGYRQNYLNSGRTGISNAIFVLLALVFLCLAAGEASAETRKLKLYFLHTGERAEITFKKNGKYVKGGLKKINRFLRDWRRNEPTKMDPRLLDLIWEIYRETKSRKHIHVVSGYRSPATNSLLRKRGRGVAKKSQHTLGKAMDFFIPGVSLRKLRYIGLKKGFGGVGYYPKSGSPFVHMDTGRVRHWPRMSRKELARVFPKGKTLHVPTDGKPLARYNQAKAEYERKIKGGGKFVIAKAEEIEKKPGFFAKLLGRGEDEEGQLGAVSAPKPVAVAVAVKKQKAPEPVKPEPNLAVPTVPKPEEVVPDQPEPQQVATPEIILASLPSNLLPVPVSAPRAVAENPTPEENVAEEPVADTIVADAQTPDGQNGEGLLFGQAEPENGAGETIELAYGIPLPAQRPVSSPAESILAGLEPGPAIDIPAPTKEPVLVAALSPVEIEDLRAQVYAVLVSKGDAETKIAADAVSEPEIVVAEVKASAIDGGMLVSSANARETGNTLSLFPQPNPRKIAAIAIEKRLAVLTPLEPGVDTKNITAVPSVRPENEAPEIEVPEVAVASLEPLEPSSRTTEQTGFPLPNPDHRVEIEKVEPETEQGIAVPIPAVRLALETESSPAKNPGAKSSKSRLAVLASSASTEKKLGKWALAADTLIARIDDIRPPAYAKNIIRERPSSVLSQGFVTNGSDLTTSSFSGSSIEFLDFTRF